MSKETFLGDLPIERYRFLNLETVFLSFHEKAFLSLNEQERNERVNLALCELIKKESAPCFLLPAVLEFIERIEKEKVLEHFTFSSFELWLNQFSHLEEEENRWIRGKIAGKWVERGEYQRLFPIGMGKVFEGTHFVTAHKSPDLDTTVASFWGWMDAFAARVGDGLHIWNLPGGPPSSQIEIDLVFKGVFGDALFTHLAKTRNELNLTGHDLMSQKELLRVTLQDSIASIDHERDHNAVIIVDDQGFYLGDWRNIDVEGVRQVIILLGSCVRWFENALHLQLISLLAKKTLYFEDLSPKLKAFFSLKIDESEPASSFSSKEKKHVNDFVVKVLELKKGLSSSFEELIQHLAKLSVVSWQGHEAFVKAMRPLFDAKGTLLENRPHIFQFLEETIGFLHEAIVKIRARLEKLDIALKTKAEVFNLHPTFVTMRSEVEEIRSKMGSYQTLTVTYLDGKKFFPIGAIHASDLRKKALGTVSLRDFCNKEEMTIPSYLDVISVIDHHKSELNTTAPPLAIIADVQSSNTLVASCAFEINDRYTKTPLQRQKNSTSQFFIHPLRERIEYLHFLYAILDDTDLLSKVSAPDVECVASLLNRLKTLSMQKEVEIVTLDDLPRDKNFPKKAAERILQNQDMYSLYRKVYLYKEKEVERNLELAATGKPSTAFADTKEQNGCCRIGQTKVFANNISFFFKHADAIRRVWLETSKKVSQEKPDIVLYLHMISTIVSAEEVFQGKTVVHLHKDELWIWIPPGEHPVEMLKRFLHNFQNSPGLKGNPLEVEFLGENSEELSLIFKESFLEIPQTVSKRGLPIAVLKFKAGALNSRKAMVSPFLPTVRGT